MDGSLFLDDSSLRILRIGLLGLLAHVHALDDGTLLFGIDCEHLPLLAAAVACDDINHVALLDM